LFNGNLNFFVDANNDDAQPNKILLPALPMGVISTILKSGVKFTIRCRHINTNSNVKLFFADNLPEGGISIKTAAGQNIPQGYI
jgi:hypothetical protein